MAELPWLFKILQGFASFYFKLKNPAKVNILGWSASKPLLVAIQILSMVWTPTRAYEGACAPCRIHRVGFHAFDLGEPQQRIRAGESLRSVLHIPPKKIDYRAKAYQRASRTEPTLGTLVGSSIGVATRSIVLKPQTARKMMQDDPACQPTRLNTTCFWFRAP